MTNPSRIAQLSLVGNLPWVRPHVRRRELNTKIYSEGLLRISGISI